MSRLMKTIYVDNPQDAAKVDRWLESNKHVTVPIQTLDWEVDWEEVDDETQTLHPHSLPR